MRAITTLVVVLATVLVAVSSAGAEDKPKIRLSGYMHADYYSGDAGNVDDEDDGFFMRRVRLTARGTMHGWIGYNLGGAYDASDDDASSASVKVLNAFLDLKFAPKHQLRVGQFKYSFDLDGRRSASRLPMATRAQVVNTLVGKLGREGASFRDVGLELSGNGGDDVGWSYAAGVVNGNGINKRENNGAKDFFGRFAVKPTEGLSVGAGYFTGEGKLSPAATEEDETTWTVDVAYEHEALALYGAYFAAEFDQPGGAPAIEPEGWYAVGAYRVRPKIELAARYQEFDQDSSATDRSFESVDVAVNYYFNRKDRWSGTRLGLTYMARDAEAGAGTKVWEERGAAVTGAEVDDVIILRLQVLYP